MGGQAIKHKWKPNLVNQIQSYGLVESGDVNNFK
jgi:hypothetical protein